MQFFVDTADTNEIRELAASGLLDGVTTNPSLVAKSGRDFFEVLREISKLVAGPISAEVTAADAQGMVDEGQRLARIASNIVVKVPLTWEGLKACRLLVNEGIGVNVTLCFSVNQALLAAKAGATYVSPFVGRLDDIGENGMHLIADIKNVYDHYEGLSTKILVASIRSADHVKEAALIGAHVATVPPAILRELVKHALTDKGLAAFNADWAKTGQSILKR